TFPGPFTLSRAHESVTRGTDASKQLPAHGTHSPSLPPSLAPSPCRRGWAAWLSSVRSGWVRLSLAWAENREDALRAAERRIRAPPHKRNPPHGSSGSWHRRALSASARPAYAGPRRLCLRGPHHTLGVLERPHSGKRRPFGFGDRRLRKVDRG